MTEEVYPEVATIEANRLVPIYLMSSYLYYEKNLNILSDVDFDAVCLRLVQEWDDIEHVHKDLLDLDSLQAGPGYDVDYTQMIEMSATHWYDQWLEKNSLDSD